MDAGLRGGGDINFGIRAAQLELVSELALKDNGLCRHCAQRFIPALQEIRKNGEVQKLAFQVADERRRVSEIDVDGGKRFSELVGDLNISHSGLPERQRSS
jgi:hypothetical protein